jgi:hypothetical protein
VNVFISVLLGLVGALLQLALAYLLSPPRIEWALRLGQRVKGTAFVPLNASSSIMLAIQNQQFQAIDRITVELSTDPLGAFLTHNPWGYLGTPEDREAVTAAWTSPDRRKLRIELDRIRALKTLVFEIPCSEETTKVEGRLHGKRRSLGQLVSSQSHGGLELGPFSFPFSVHRSHEDGDGDATVRPWGERFPKRRPQDAAVLLVGSALAIVLFELFSRMLGSEGLWTAQEWLTTIAILAPALAVLALVYWLVRPKPKPIAQGYFEPVEIPVRPFVTAGPRGE